MDVLSDVLCSIRLTGAVFFDMEAHSPFRPSEDWTVEALARDVGLSRSIFAKRFNDLVGVPPIEYVTRWLLTRAQRLPRQPAA